MCSGTTIDERRCGRARLTSLGEAAVNGLYLESELCRVLSISCLAFAGAVTIVIRTSLGRRQLGSYHWLTSKRIRCQYSLLHEKFSKVQIFRYSSAESCLHWKVKRGKSTCCPVGGCAE